MDVLNHGFDLVDVYDPVGIAFAVGIPAMFFLLVVLYKSLGWWEGQKTKTGEEVCKLVAYEYTFGLFCAWFPIHGIRLYMAWGVNDLYTEPIASNIYYGRSQYVVQNLLYPMMWYQFWNVVFALLIKDLFAIDSVVHHVLTGFTQCLGFNGFLNYHSYFFIGIVEMSSLPLAIVDMTRYDVDFDKRHSVLYHCCKTAFALSFVVTRNIIWPFMAIPCLIDLYQIIITGKAHSVPIVAGFMLVTVLLTLLQMKWGYKVIRLTLKSFGKEEQAKKAKNV